MARPKRGQLMQFMAPARSSSDGSLITTMTASDFNSGAVCKWFGVNHGASAAYTSGTLSKAVALVSSGLLQFTLNATENNYDEMVFRARKTSMKPLFVAWNNADYDDSDLMSRLSDIGSDLRSYVVENRSQLSDVQSALTIVSSRVLLTQSLASDAASAAQQANSRVLLCQSRISDAQSFLSDFQSDLISHLDTTGVGLNASTMSDIRSAINALTVTIGASDISDIASAVVAGLPVTSQVSDIYSMLSDLMSDFQSRVPKRVATDSQLSDLASDLRSYLVAMSGAISDVESQLDLVPTTNNSDAISNVYSLLTLVASNVSDVESQLDLVPTANNSDAISNVYSLLALVASNVSDVESQLDLNASMISDVQSAVAAVQADLPQRITKNTALAGFPFFMVSSSDHVTGATGLTVTATRSLDGAAFGSCANSVSEIANGWYSIDLAAGDLNGNTVALKFTATGADARNITIVTEPT